MNKPGLPIVLQGITKSWAGAVALDDVHLTIPAGQFWPFWGHLDAENPRFCA